MNIRERLNELAANLYWTWHPEAVHVFRDLDQDLWRTLNHNPIAFLASLSDDRLDQSASLLALESRIIRAFHILRDYRSARDTWGSRYAGALRAAPVAYFSAEFGLHESMPIYSGGLGVLAGDHLKAASDLGVAIVGVGLLYKQGYFRQSLDARGWQQEHYIEADVGTLPVKPVNDPEGHPVRIELAAGDGCSITVQAWVADVGRGRLVLLDTNVDGNAPEIRDLTAQLYGGDSRMRIRQELVLGVGGMRALQAMGIRPGVLHLNEGHSAFALLELARQFMERDGQSFQDVREKVAAMTVFTTHTPVPAGHDRFDAKLVADTLSPLRRAIGLSEDDLMALGRVSPNDAHESFCMTVLGLRLSRVRNAVSHLHCRVSKAMWRGVWPDRSEERIPIGYITNGVHISSWLAPEMNRLYTRCLGDRWMEHLYDPAMWKAVEDIGDEELWETNETLLGHLIGFVRRRVRRQCESRGEPDPTSDPAHPYLSVHPLTIGFARRFAIYKRGNLLLHDLDRLNALVNHPERPVQIVFAGKAHPQDQEAKRIIQRIFDVTRDPRLVGKIAFIEDYDINVARHLVQGVDLWLNTPRRPNEACGTSGMKAMLNANLNLSVLDGWWAEAYDGLNGFAIGDAGEHSDWGRQDGKDLDRLYGALENEVVPLFYDREEDGLPREWIRRKKHALRTLAWRFSAQRMVTDYVRHCYLPSIGGVTSSFVGSVPARIA